MSIPESERRDGVPGNPSSTVVSPPLPDSNHHHPSLKLLVKIEVEAFEDCKSCGSPRNSTTYTNGNGLVFVIPAEKIDISEELISAATVFARELGQLCGSLGILEKVYREESNGQ